MFDAKNLGSISGIFSAIRNKFSSKLASEYDVTRFVPDDIVHRRFLNDNPVAYKKAIKGAKKYVSKLSDGDVAWLHYKPFDPTSGNPQYFRLMFDLLNILQAMELPENARILEIGSGPGWVTEILIMLGYSVDALEPSSDLIKVAQERCAALGKHYRYQGKPSVRFHKTTIEKIEFEDQSFDAILYFDVLHHVVDEHIAMQKSFKFLKPGGCLGVVEGAWHPEFKLLEQGLMEEMAQFGTLENPFSAKYLDYLLSKAGFIDLQRYVAVNGFFSENKLARPLHHFSVCPLDGSNNVTARKPGSEDTLYASCTDSNFKTDAGLTLLSGGIDPINSTASLKIKFENAGETRFDSRTNRTGHISFSLRQCAPGAELFVEAKERCPLLVTMIPGSEVEMQLDFTLPQGASLDNWELDIVAEGAFWFSSKGINSCAVPVLHPQ